jgi:hypothetical protein
MDVISALLEKSMHPNDENQRLFCCVLLLPYCLLSMFANYDTHLAIRAKSKSERKQFFLTLLFWREFEFESK